MSGLRRTLCSAAALLVATTAAQAESCTRTRDYIFDNASDLPQKTGVYRDLYRNCMETLTFSNVRDAFVLKDGSIAVLARDDGVGATAATLAQFCRRFPRGTLHFIPRARARETASTARAVSMASTRATPCGKIVGP